MADASAAVDAVMLLVLALVLARLPESCAGRGASFSSFICDVRIFKTTPSSSTRAVSQVLRRGPAGIKRTQ